jgi:hypothetical protein
MTSHKIKSPRCNSSHLPLPPDRRRTGHSRDDALPLRAENPPRPKIAFRIWDKRFFSDQPMDRILIVCTPRRSGLSTQDDHGNSYGRYLPVIQIFEWNREEILELTCRVCASRETVLSRTPRNFFLYRQRDGANPAIQRSCAVRSDRTCFKEFILSGGEGTSNQCSDSPVTISPFGL